MFPVVCILRAGLYVGLGGFGMAMAKSVSSGSFDGRGGPLPVSGIPRGPCGLEKVFPQFPGSTPGIESGTPCTEDTEPLELGREDSDCPKPRSFAKRSERASADGGKDEPLATGPTDDTARECRLSGLGETDGFTFCVEGTKTFSEPFLVWYAVPC